MPKRTALKITSAPYRYKTKDLCMQKSFCNPDFKCKTIFTDDPFTYVEFFFSAHPKAMKYHDTSLKLKYGSETKYHYSFYWQQAKEFYHAAKTLSFETAPLLSYYAMLNAVKAYLSYKSVYIDDFITSFVTHGLSELNTSSGIDLENTMLYRKENGVFPAFAKKIEPNFDTLWPSGKPNAVSLKKLLYNLAFVHRAYITTYSSASSTIPELFIPLRLGHAPTYNKGNDSNLYLICELDKTFFSATATNIPIVYIDTISDQFCTCDLDNFKLRSTTGAKRNSSDSLSGEFRELNSSLRREFQYIHSPRKLWYLKRSRLTPGNIMDLNSMVITMAAMHRLSEIARYKPEQLAHLMKSRENWLIHEFITLAIDQFIDEISSEITGQELMCTGIRN